MNKQELWNRCVNIIIGADLEAEETKKVVTELFNVLREYCYPEMFAAEKISCQLSWIRAQRYER